MILYDNDANVHDLSDLQKGIQLEPRCWEDFLSKMQIFILMEMLLKIFNKNTQ